MEYVHDSQESEIIVHLQENFLNMKESEWQKFCNCYPNTKYSCSSLPEIQRYLKFSPLLHLHQPNTECTETTGILVPDFNEL